MFKLKFKLLAAATVLLCAGSAFAQDSGPLIDLLVKKGLINDQEGEELRADLAKDASAAVVSTISGGKSTMGLSITGRIQAQFVNLTTDINGTDADPAAISHFFLRRVYLGAKADVGKGFSANFNYDFAGSTFDAAFIQWRHSDELVIDVGLRKAPFAYDEWLTSSGKLKTIERSPLTRYFVEGNNGRRLGAGSYRQGVFVSGKTSEGLFYTGAITNPERDESSAGAAGAGSAANNNFAYWGNVGLSKTFTNGTYVVGASVGFLPDQGGKTLGAGNDLTVYGVFGDISYGIFSLVGEFDYSNNEKGASATRDSNAWGWYLQPSVRLGADYEFVGRYTFVDSDYRGVSLSDGTRSGAGGGTMNLADETFLGVNRYFRGWDLVLQAGYLIGTTRDNLNGTPAKATVQGFRSQLQVNF